MSSQNRHPYHSAIQKSMEHIVEMVSYNDVKYKVYSRRLLQPEDLDEYDNLINREAVGRMVRKLMVSFTGCEQFLEILQEMTSPQYGELVKIIDDAYEQIKKKVVLKLNIKIRLKYNMKLSALLNNKLKMPFSLSHRWLKMKFKKC